MRRSALMVLACLVVLLGGVSCGLDVSTPETKLEIEEQEFIVTEYTAMVVGIARNVTGQELEWPMIVVTMQDEADEDIYIGADRIERLGPGEAWRFEVKYLDGTASDYEILYEHILNFG